MTQTRMAFATLYGKLLLATLVISATTGARADALGDTIEAVEKRIGGNIGVAVYDTGAKSLWQHDGDSRFPLMSTFKTLACAKLLADAEQGHSSLNSTVVIKQQDLVTYSPVTKQQVNQSFSLQQACRTTLATSDNTAANIVLNGIGGPIAFTDFMRSIGDDATRLDRLEPFLNEAAKGDPRDTTTPTAMVKSLDALLYGDFLSESSKQQLTQWMKDNRVSDSLLRAVLPEGWQIADKSGAGGNGSRGIVGSVWKQNRAPILVSIYITQSQVPFKQRNQAIAEIGDAIFKRYL